MKDEGDLLLEKNAFLRESILLIVRTVFFGVLTLEIGFVFKQYAHYFLQSGIGGQIYSNPLKYFSNFDSLSRYKLSRNLF